MFLHIHPRLAPCGSLNQQDVHKRQITYCILDRVGATLREGESELTRELLTQFPSTQLRPTDHVVLESTTNCWAVVEILQRHVGNVVVSNPMATKVIAQSKIKTDKVDAKVLAQLLRCDFVPTVWQPDADTRLRRQVSSRRASLVGQRTQLQNRIHSVLAMRLIIPPGEMSLFGPHGIAWLKSLTDYTIDADGLMMIRSDLRLLESVEVEILVFDQRLAELGWKDERVKLLMTIPSPASASWWPRLWSLRLETSPASRLLMRLRIIWVWRHQRGSPTSRCITAR